MQERTRNPIHDNISLGNDPWDAAGEVGGHVHVTNGPYHEDLPIVHMTIGEVRRRFEDVLDLSADAIAVLDGHEVDDDTRVRAGQTLAFRRDGGEKGVAA